MAPPLGSGLLTRHAPGFVPGWNLPPGFESSHSEPAQGQLSTGKNDCVDGRHDQRIPDDFMRPDCQRQHRDQSQHSEENHHSQKHRTQHCVGIVRICLQDLLTPRIRAVWAGTSGMIVPGPVGVACFCSAGLLPGRVLFARGHRCLTRSGFFHRDSPGLPPSQTGRARTMADRPLLARPARPGVAHAAGHAASSSLGPTTPRTAPLRPPPSPPGGRSGGPAGRR